MGGLADRIDRDGLSDNRGYVGCLQCRGCIFVSNSDIYSNRFYKSSCRVYPYPDMKPIGVIDGTEECVFREVEAD